MISVLIILFCAVALALLNMEPKYVLYVLVHQMIVPVQVLVRKKEIHVHEEWIVPFHPKYQRKLLRSTSDPHYSFAVDVAFKLVEKIDRRMPVLKNRTRDGNQ